MMVLKRTRQGERELVTVMFVDVPGINLLADVLGLEESLQVLESVITLMFSATTGLFWASWATVS